MKGDLRMNTVELAHGYALAVGTALQIRIEDLDYMVGCEFIGAGDDGQLRLALDDAAEAQPGRLKPGMVLSAYYLGDGVYHMFSSRFERFVDDPRPAMVLQVPQEVLNIERRSQRRIKCALPARVDIRKSLAMEITDINHKGCRVEVDAASSDAVRLEPSDRIRLRIRAPEAPHGFIVEGQVRNVQAQGEKLQAGVSFETLPETLITFIESLAAEDG